MSRPDRPQTVERSLDLLEVLGRGGFGSVYLADLHGLDGFVQRVAVKVLDARLSETQAIAARQRDEARLLARLNHDHIVKVFDLTTVDGRPAVVMEYVEGVDLGQLVRQGPLPTKAALQAVALAASALWAAWECPDPATGAPLRVVHRDIKPSNLFLSKHGGLKVLDFGIARGDFDRESATGSVQFGTSRFMAPEQWLYREVSHKVDVYALGVTLIELLAGAALERPPLDPERFATHMDAAVRAVVDPGLPAGVPADLAALAHRMLAFTAADRPDACAIHDHLLELVDALPGEGLGRYARRVVPPLVHTQRPADDHDPLLSDARRTFPLTPGPGRSAGLTSLDHPRPIGRSSSAAPTRPLQPDSPPARNPNVAATEADPSPRPPNPPAGRSRPFGTMLFTAAVGALVVVAVGLWTHTLLTDAPSTGLGPSPATARPAPEIEPSTTLEPPAKDAKSSDDVQDSPPPAAVTRPRPDPSSTGTRTPQPSAPSPARAEPPEAAPEAAPPQADADPAAPAPPSPVDAPEPKAPGRRMTLTSSPIGARVTVAGRTLPGTTPVVVSLPRGSHALVIEKDGQSCSGTVAVSPLAAATVRCDLAAHKLTALR